jgi:hypothetical protein
MGALKTWARRSAFAACAAVFVSFEALAGPPWMSEEAIRSAFIGRTLDGHYGNGVTWTETYTAEGRLDYRERGRRAVGDWHFRPGGVFCTFYDPPFRPALTGGCWTVIKASANCYEFFMAGGPDSVPDDDPQAPAARWNAQGWRQGEPSTCQEKPAV